MAFGIWIFIVAITCSHIGAQTIQSIQPTHGTKVSTISTSQAEDTTISSSTIVAITDTSDTPLKNEDSTSVATDVPITWSSATIRNEEHTGTVMANVDFPSVTSVESTNSTMANSETIHTYMTDKLEAYVNDTYSFDASVASTLAHQVDVDESVKESEIIITEDDTYIPTSSDQWSIKNTSRESRMFTTDATNEQQDYQLIILKSNCSIVNSESIPLSEDLRDVGCTIHLRMNLSLENTTRDQLLRTLEKLNIKPQEFQLVEMHNQNERDASGHEQQDKHHGFVFDQETFAYLAVAIAFAFLLLLAIMVFGLRCFKKRRPSLDISRFDVRLSNYTLTKIPRASLSALDSLHESDCLDDKLESSSPQNKNSVSCESGLDIIACESFSSNREMKTFGVSRPSVSRNSDSPSDMHPQHNPVSYENHTFQRYF